MKENIYRSWNQQSNQFYYFKNGRYYYDSECTHCLSERVCSEFQWNSAEQFIGLKDFYEGDIFSTGYSVRIVKYGEYPEDYNDGRCTIKEIGFGWYYEDNYGSKKGLFSTMYGEWNYKKVGNIHENPELLTNNHQ